ncbi:ribosomal protein S18-alanine N-acetyltransferase [Rothia sp. CCM 9418]|uniref:ribosomal protein S18-alanine N-acetyltransferase n=1 Tax=unclassified Rothia (in: high G+C Gram-positive bacteria) TaxID=2689056 RepID=UPI003AD075DA
MNQTRTASDGSAVVLRELELVDIEQIHRLECELFPVDAWPIEMFLAEVQHPTRYYIVLEQDHKIIGYAGVMTVADTADIQTLAICPSKRRCGYGTWLLETLHEQACARGAQRVMLEVRADNPAAQNLYVAQGYLPVHRRERYYNDGVDALIMMKDLEAVEPLQEEKHHDQ